MMKRTAFYEASRPGSFATENQSERRHESKRCVGHGETTWNMNCDFILANAGARVINTERRNRILDPNEAMLRFVVVVVVPYFREGNEAERGEVSDFSARLSEAVIPGRNAGGGGASLT